jgi:Trp operon repressor
MFEMMLKLVMKYNKEQDEKGKACIYFSCHKEGHTTHNCSLVFPHKKKQNFERIGAMLAKSNCFKRKKDEINPLNLDLIAEVEKNSSVVYVDEIVEYMFHDSFSQREIIERLKNKILEFELNIQSYESKLQNLKKNY